MKITIFPSSVLLSSPNLGPNIFIKSSVTDVLQFEKQLPPFSIGTGSAEYGPSSEPLYTVRITLRTIDRNTLLSPNHNMDHCLTKLYSPNQNMDPCPNHNFISKSQFGPLSESHYALRIRIWNIVWTTLLSSNHNTDHCLNHITISESQYGPLSEPHYYCISESQYGPLFEPYYYLRITIRSIVWTTLCFPNQNQV